MTHAPGREQPRRTRLAGRPCPVRFAGGDAFARPRLAAVLLGPARTGLGAARLVRRRARGRAIDLGDLGRLELLRVRIPHTYHIDDRRDPAGIVPGLSAADGPADDLECPGRRCSICPLLSALFFTACPGFSPDRTGSVYLVNCLGLPSDADRVAGTGSGCGRRRSGQLHSARVVAVAGQEVEWTGHHWLVDGQDQHAERAPSDDRLAASPVASRSPRTSSWSSPRKTDVDLRRGGPALPGRSRSDHGSRLGPLLPRLGSSAALSVGRHRRASAARSQLRRGTVTRAD